MFGASAPFHAGQLIGLISNANSVQVQDQEHQVIIPAAAVVVDVVNEEPAEMQVDLDQEKIKSKKADLARTLFVGNVPLQAEVKAVKKVLVQVGIPGKNIVSVRFRSVPINAVNMPRKYAIAQNKLNVDHRASKNAYVCLSDQDALKDALVLLKSKRESLVIDDHHLRFDSAAQKSKEELSKENDRTVFLGNLSFDIEEEEIRNHFSECGTVDDVRVVRDRKTNAGKGFAYVKFTDKSSVKKALLYNGTALKERNIRVKKALDEAQIKAVQEKRNLGNSKVKKSSNNKTNIKGKKTAGEIKPKLSFQGIEAKKNDNSSNALQRLLFRTKKSKKQTAKKLNVKTTASKAK